MNLAAAFSKLPIPFLQTPKIQLGLASSVIAVLLDLLEPIAISNVKAVLKIPATDTEFVRIESLEMELANVL